ncbi:phage scaffolding protein, partial [Lactococcus lactis]
MTKEELLALGLTEEQAKGVFALNGKVIEHEQAKAKAEFEKVTAERDGLKNDLASVQKDLKSYSKQAADNEELAAK